MKKPLRIARATILIRVAEGRRGLISLTTHEKTSGNAWLTMLIRVAEGLARSAQIGL